MESRLTSLDAELDKTEAALRALAIEIEAPKVHPPRFRTQLAQDGVALKPERADPIVHRSKPSFTFRSRQDESESVQCIDTVTNQAEPIKPIQQVHPSSSPIGVASFSKSPRWAPNPTDQSLQIWLHLAFAGEELGIVLERGAAIVRSIKTSSPASTWNRAQCQAAPGLMLQPGDRIVSVNGIRIDAHARVELSSIVADSLEVHLVVHRASGANSSKPRLRLGNPASSSQSYRGGTMKVGCASQSTKKDELRLRDLYEDLEDLRQCLPSPPSAVTKPGMRDAATHVKACTFGSEARFGIPTAKEEGLAVLSPNDRCLSNHPTPRCAIIPPPSKAKPKQGLKAFLSALDGTLDRQVAIDEASTDVGSERGDAASSVWSSPASETTEVPGPGSYCPDFSVGRPSLSRGTPQFSRYSARERSSAPENAESETSQSQEGSAKQAPTQSSKPLKIAGGCINPVPSSKPRGATAKEMEKRLSSNRPFYTNHQPIVEESTPNVIFAASSDQTCETGRLKKILPTKPLGPGHYSLPGLPKGFEAFMVPEPVPDPEPPTRQRQRSEPPGPAHYDSTAAVGLVYPRPPAADFRQSPAHSMSFQFAPSYVIKYRALDPRWDAIRRRSLSATVLPLPSSQRRLLQRPRPALGPGSYECEETNQLNRLRPDVSVLRWSCPNFSEVEHTHALFNPRPVDNAIQGDPRDLLDPEADVLTRPRHPVADFRPHSAAPLPPHPQVEGGRWILYDLPPLSPPIGDVNFSRRIDFEEFPSREAVWNARQELGKQRREPNVRLTYSLPDLESLRERAPQYDFGVLQGRAVSDPGDSPREGDVLLLSLDAERDLLHPKMPQFVDMSKQMGRAEAGSMFPEPNDDVEELILSPRPVERRVPVYVDMSKSPGRPGLDFSAHLWADENGTLYAYQPSAGLHLRDELAEELLLSPMRGQRYLERSPTGGNFSHALGRSGIDPRVPEGTERDQEDEILLTNWQPRFRSPQRGRSPHRSSDFVSDTNHDMAVNAPDIDAPDHAVDPIE